MRNTRPADPRAAHVINFCRNIATEAAPVTMALRPELGCEPLDCFSNVRRKVERSGGTIRYGWSIWEWPNVYIEAEHHAVYEDVEGKLTDLTPPADTWTPNRTFLPDSSAVYDFDKEGVRRDNYRLALANDPLIEEFFETARAFNREMSKISGVGEVSVDSETARKLQYIQSKNAEILLVLLMKYTPQGAICFCGSSKKFKRCHGKKQ